jgi:hypothetical protein
MVLAEGADGGGDALARGDGRAAQAGADRVVVEILDEAQPQRGARRLGKRRDQRLEAAEVVLR